VRVNEGVKQLRREGKRGGEGLGISLPIVGAEGVLGGVAGEVDAIRLMQLG
jgi:hypothetical protein